MFFFYLKHFFFSNKLSAGSRSEPLVRVFGVEALPSEAERIVERYKFVNFAVVL